MITHAFLKPIPEMEMYSVSVKSLYCGSPIIMADKTASANSKSLLNRATAQAYTLPSGGTYKFDLLFIPKYLFLNLHLFKVYRWTVFLSKVRTPRSSIST